MRFLDLFAGIGGFRLSLERAGHECIGFCEIDKYARQTYKANFNTEGEVEWHDITTVTDSDIRSIGHIDIVTGGFPCQSFSIAGKRGGFDDTRGTLFFDIARIARILQTKYLLLENVKGLLNHEGGETFRVILNTLGELGYWWEFQVFNSKNYGVPQNRERVFIVGHLRGSSGREVFPIEGENSNPINVIGKLGCINNDMRSRVYAADGIGPTLNTVQGGANEPKVVVPVLTPGRPEKRQNGRRFKEPGDPMFTLTAQDRHGVLVSQKSGVQETETACTLDASYYKGLGCNQERTGVLVAKGDCLQRSQSGVRNRGDEYGTLRAGASRTDFGVCDGYRIRKLTPLECFRLQGFPDSHHDNAKAAGVSDSQLYKQAGNAVSVPVVEAIVRKLEVAAE